MNSDNRYRASHLDSVPLSGTDIPDEGRWRPVRHHLGIAAFGVNVYRADRSGGGIIGQHDHSEEGDPPHEELYLVVRGHARFVLDGEVVDAPLGTFVAVKALDVMREAIAMEDGTEILAIGSEVGGAYQVSAWEQQQLS